MSEKKISVVIPIYNTEKYLETCLKSVMNQTWKNLEIILVDDGSRDQSGEICDTYAKKDPRIVVIHKENGGLSSARNAGINVATGEYIGFVDSDDWISETMYEHLMQAVEHTGASVAVCSMKEMSEYTKVDVPYGEEMLLSAREAIGRFFNRLISESVCDKLYKRSLFESLRFSEGEINEDTVVAYRIMAGCGQAVQVDSREYFYRKRQGSITKSGYSDKFRMVEKHLEEIQTLVEDSYPDAMDEMKYFFSIHYYCLLLSVVKSGEWKRYREDYKRYRKAFIEYYPQFRKKGTGKRKDRILAAMLRFRMEWILWIRAGEEIA